MKPVAGSIAFLLILSNFLFTADDPAKGHFDSAVFLMKDKKYSQALDDLNFIVKSYPQSPLADDALLMLGTYSLNEAKNLDQALSYFQQIKDKYTESNSAPAAYYYIGVIHLDRRTSNDLTEAYANFERVTRIFPSSSWVDKSLVGAGMALEWQGDYDKAYEAFSEVKIRFASSPLAARAQYEMGICLLYVDSFLDASTDFQQVIDGFPESEFAKKALEINTLLYRLYLTAPTDKNAYTPDATFTPVLRELDDPTGLAIDSKQNLYLSDKGNKTVLVFDPSGKQLNSISALSPYFISIDDQDRAIVANDTNVIVVGGQPVSFDYSKESGKLEPVTEIRSAAINRSGEFLIASDKWKGLLAYDQNIRPLSSAGYSKMEKEFAKVIVNARNQVYALDKQRKQVVVFDAAGKTLFGIGPAGKGFEFDRIDDFAVDQANHIYLLTKNPRGVSIFSPTGSLMKFIGSDKKTPIAFEDAKVITVGPSGSIYILDKDLHKILKLG
jgi:TolA-binding protein